jgi:hypothetical protein
MFAPHKKRLKKGWAFLLTTPKHVFVGSITVCSITILWVNQLLTGRVHASYIGDETSRIFQSYAISTPTNLVRYLIDPETWARIHPPGDFAFKAMVNMVVWPIFESPSMLIRSHQILAWVCVVLAMLAVADGLYRRWSIEAALMFSLLWLSASPVVYIAHHAVGEALALPLIGLAVRSAFLIDWGDRTSVVKVSLLAVGVTVVRPEGVLLLGALGLLGLPQKHYRNVALYSSLTALPLVLFLGWGRVAGGESYLNIRRFPERSVGWMLTDSRLREILFGAGVFPFAMVGVLVLAVFVIAGTKKMTEGVALTVGSLSLITFFAYQIGVGAIHMQERAYVFPAMLGLVAFSVLFAEWGTIKPVVARGGVWLSVIVAIAGLLGVFKTTYVEWRNAIPLAVIQMEEELERRVQPGDAVLFDFMWWWEFDLAIYASEPGLSTPICNYFRCRFELDGSSASISRDTRMYENIGRKATAGLFLEREQPKYIAMLSETALGEWETNHESSFLMPHFRSDSASCLRTMDGLVGALYCPVRRNGKFALYERVDP